MSHECHFEYCEYDTEPLKGLPQRLSALRPVINITLINKKYPQHHQSVKALVDSGADLCIFDAEIADLIGIVFDKGDEVAIEKVGRSSIKAYFHQLEMSINDIQFECYAGFSKNLATNGFVGFLGQTGFFDQFKIMFDYKAKKIKITKS